MTTLRTGITTGTCAAAAAKAAALVLTGNPAPTEVVIELPNGDTLRVAVQSACLVAENRAVASVRKDAGDDPDVTHGRIVVATTWWASAPDAPDSPGAPGEPRVTLLAGDGVGMVTRPGLQVPPGQPAINPVPRRMIEQAVAAVTERCLCVEISIPGGRELAAQTFNPRLGIVGGLSILGTTGIVRPYCAKALRDALRCGLDVAAACGVTGPVLVPGNIGAKAAARHLAPRDEQLIEVGNEWGFVLDQIARYAFERLAVVGHPGKLAKLSAAQWDTHSARSLSPVGIVAGLYVETFGTGLMPATAVLSQACPGGKPNGEDMAAKGAAMAPIPAATTVEGLFAGLPPADRRTLGDALASGIATAVAGRVGANRAVAVLLVNMAGEELGRYGDFAPWRRT
jgi:cobalt-precorrin-5B (C1)-methyltransferase